MSEQRGRTYVLVDVAQRLQRQLIINVLEQQTDLKVLRSKPSQVELDLWKTLGKRAEQWRADDRVVVVMSVDHGAAAFRGLCKRCLDQFPELSAVVGIDWSRQQAYVVRYELRCDRVRNTLRDVLASIRDAEGADND